MTTGFKLQDDEHLDAEGLPVCNNCGGRRAIVIPGVKTIPRMMCECQTEALAMERYWKKRKEAYDEQMRAQRYSPLRRNFKDASFETLIMEGKDESFKIAVRRAIKYCQQAETVLSKGYGIYLYSYTPGVGKTHIMNCMASELNKDLYSTLVISEGDILRAFKATFDGRETERNVIDKITAVNFLFIDDIGTEAYNYGDQAKWIQQKMYDIVDRRYNSGLPTVFSSNYSLRELVTKAGILAKTVDRINGMATAVLKIEGESSRISDEEQAVF